MGLTDPSDVGSVGVNFLSTLYGYDHRGRQDRVEDPTGTIQRTVYDGLSRPVSTWIGTDDTVSGEWSPTNNGDVLQVTEAIYDNGGVGDSNVTQVDTIFDDGPSDRYTTDFKYDFRNRRIGTRGPDAVAVDVVFDNLGQAVQQNTYADLDLEFDLDATELRARTDTSFDDQRRVYQSSSYEVDQTDGTIGDRLTSNVWYNHRGLQVKTAGPNGLFSKTIYDGAGRGVISLASIDDDETTWSEALDATGDTVIEQSQAIYDAGSRVVAGLSYQRFEDDASTTGLLDGANSYRDASVTWYDRADRVTHSATCGRDEGPTYYVFDAAGQIIDGNANGIPDEAESNPREPNQSADWIASKTQYDAAGRAFRTTDNLGRIMHTDFDLLNRTIRVIENYVDGVVTETERDTDQTVEYDYDDAGRMSVLRARNPKGSGNGVEDQETKYLFESPISASWTTNVIYPDSADIDSSGIDQVKTTYDRLGRTVATTDQRGVEHTFTFDAAGRLSSDAITNLGPSGVVDDAILRIERTYDDMSRVETITSYDAAAGGNVVNQVAYEYNGYQLVSETKQEHDGAVDANTLSVQYNYDDGLPPGSVGGEAPFVRLTSVEYPNGRTVHYIYPASGIGDALSRVEAIADDPLGSGLPTAPYLAQYSYFGAGTIVAVAHPAVTGGLTLDYNATSNYEGWDRFGRVLNQQWTDGAGTTTLDHYTYTYDYNSNRRSRSNPLHSALDESYTYDELDRLADVDRNGNDFQSWNLDSLGNWDTFTDQGSTETREHNAANELTGIAGGIDPTFDAAGNMTSGPKPDSPTDQQHYEYDAWNRLVRVSADDGFGNPGALSAEFEYDGRNFRIQKTAGGVLQAFYYNDRQQLLEVRNESGTHPSEQYVWDLRFIDAPIVFFRDADTNGTVDNTLYYANDANMNVTALIDAFTGDVVERYHYDPYGKLQTYDGTWTPQSSSAFDNVYLFTGRRLDADTGLLYYRARYYDNALGRFIARDPIEYGGGLNVYTYVRGRPMHAVDPSGLVDIGWHPSGFDLLEAAGDAIGDFADAIGDFFNPAPASWTGDVVTGEQQGNIWIGKAKKVRLLMPPERRLVEYTDDPDCCRVWQYEYYQDAILRYYASGTIATISTVTLTHEGDAFRNKLQTASRIGYVLDLIPGVPDQFTDVIDAFTFGADLLTMHRTGQIKITSQVFKTYALDPSKFNVHPVYEFLGNSKKVKGDSVIAVTDVLRGKEPCLLAYRDVLRFNMQREFQIARQYPTGHPAGILGTKPQLSNP